MPDELARKAWADASKTGISKTRTTNADQISAEVVSCLPVRHRVAIRDGWCWYNAQFLAVDAIGIRDFNYRFRAAHRGMEAFLSVSDRWEVG
jgi:hypothetical protein